MKSRHPLAGLVVLAAASFIASTVAQAEPRYRITPITGAPEGFFVQASDLNDRGEVVGLIGAGTGEQHAFRWRNGVFTDLHGLIDAAATATAASNLNDRGTIVGTIDGGSRAFKLQGTNVTAVSVISGEAGVFPIAINNRGQMAVEVAGGPDPGTFFLDGDRIEPLPGLPGGSGRMTAVDMNDRGAVVGNAFLANFTRHAVLWQNGVFTDLGVPPGADSTFGRDVNDFNRVVGDVVTSFRPLAASWHNGEWTLLPSIAPGETQVSSPSSINDLGAIVGATSLSSGSFATLWFLGRALVIDDLVSDSDPLKAFVHLDSALYINNRGDIVAIGVDSRTPASSDSYFLRLVDE